MPIQPGAQLKAQYENDGFVIVPDLIPAHEAVALKDEIRRILAEVRQEHVQAGGKPDDVLFGTGVFVGLAVRSPVFRALARDARLLDVLEAIIGPNIAFFSDKVVFKNTEAEFGSPWHQDWPYWQGSHKLSIWVALDDATPENGCLKLLPGSHKQVAVHDGDAGDGHGFGHRLRPEAIDESQAVTAAIGAGGAVFFHDLALHASHPNVARTDRWALISTYRDAQAEEPPYPWAVAAEVVRGRGHSANSPAEAG